MKLVLDNGKEIVLSEDVSELIKKEIEKATEPKRNFNHELVEDNNWYISYNRKVNKDENDIESLEFLNSFTNEEYTKKIARRQYIDKLILNSIDENRVNGFDKNNLQINKYEISFRNAFKCLDIYDYKINQSSSWVFPTRELAQQCIDKYKNELIEFFTMEV